MTVGTAKMKVFDDGTVQVRVRAVAARGRLLKAWKAYETVQRLKAALRGAETAYTNARAGLRGPEIAALAKLAHAEAVTVTTARGGEKVTAKNTTTVMAETHFVGDSCAGGHAGTV